MGPISTCHSNVLVIQSYYSNSLFSNIYRSQLSGHSLRICNSDIFSTVGTITILRHNVSPYAITNNKAHVFTSNLLYDPFS